MLRNSSTIKASILFLLLFSLLTFPSAGFVTEAHACYDWYVGARVALKGGSEIRHGSGLNYGIHTIVPEDNWQVDVIDGPRSADGKTWWDISRKNLDGGGTGWVYIEQAGYDVCSNPSVPIPEPSYDPPSGFSYCANEGGYCSFSGIAEVAYGVNGIFYYIYNVNGGISCNNDIFGDPVNGIGKACHYKITSQQPSEETQPNTGGDTSLQLPNSPDNTNPPSSDSNPPSNNPQADACFGYVKDFIYGYSNPPSGNYIYVPADVEKLRLRDKSNTNSCAFGWLVAGNYYQLLEEKGNWIKVLTNIGEGWVSADFVEVENDLQLEESNSENEQVPSQDLETPDTVTSVVAEVWCNAEIVDTYRSWWPGSDFLDIVITIKTPNVDSQADVQFKHNGVNAPVDFLFLGDNKWKISIGFWGDVNEWEFLYKQLGKC